MCEENEKEVDTKKDDAEGILINEGMLIRFVDSEKREYSYIPNGVRIIASRAYDSQNYIRQLNVAFADDLKTIGSEAFYNCNGIETLHLGSNLCRIEKRAIVGCPELKEVHFHDTKYWTYDIDSPKPIDEAILKSPKKAAEFLLDGEGGRFGMMKLDKDKYRMLLETGRIG